MGRARLNADRTGLIRHLFDGAAGRYEREIVPVLAPLAASLVAYAHPRPTDRVLDVGTGTGIAARHAAPYVRTVTGLDISPGILGAARQVPVPANVAYVLGDIHRPPFGAHTFTLILACFGLNGTDPNHSLRALRRVLAPGGRLVIQEWGPIGAIDEAISRALNDHLLDDPGPRVTALRAWLDTHPAVWRDYLQDADDYAEWLSESGFTVEDVTESAPVTVRLPSPAFYLTFKLAWPYRWEEVQAMDPATRAAFFAAVRAGLPAFAAPDGSLIWQPVLFRVTARG